MPLTLLTDYKFNNPHIERIPPTRELYPVDYSGKSSKGINFKFYLDRITVKDLKKDLNHVAVPKRIGDWDLMNEWIGNMWEALYNPIWLWYYKDKYAVYMGNHRFRLLDAMEVEDIYAYIQINDGDTYRIGLLLLDEGNQKNKVLNDRKPINGTIGGACRACGKNTRWRKKTFNVVSDVRLYCKLCGAENPYPWRGQI